MLWTYMLLVLECLKELFLVVLVGAATSILSAIIVIYVVTKVLGIATILDMEDEEDYILTKDDEKIPYDDETQE
jgi:hypothetical protein